MGMDRAVTSRGTGRDIPLRSHAERALNDYFASLNGHRPARLYELALFVDIYGWSALPAFVPPSERLGLVLVDPPF